MFTNSTLNPKIRHKKNHSLSGGYTFTNNRFKYNFCDKNGNNTNNIHNDDRSDNKVNTICDDCVSLVYKDQDDNNKINDLVLSNKYMKYQLINYNIELKRMKKFIINNGFTTIQEDDYNKNSKIKDQNHSNKTNVFNKTTAIPKYQKQESNKAYKKLNSKDKKLIEYNETEVSIEEDANDIIKQNNNCDYIVNNNDGERFQYIETLDTYVSNNNHHNTHNIEYANNVDGNNNLREKYYGKKYCLYLKKDEKELKKHETKQDNNIITNNSNTIGDNRDNIHQTNIKSKYIVPSTNVTSIIRNENKLKDNNIKNKQQLFTPLYLKAKLNQAAKIISESSSDEDNDCKYKRHSPSKHSKSKHKQSVYSNFNNKSINQYSFAHSNKKNNSIVNNVSNNNAHIQHNSISNINNRKIQDSYYSTLNNRSLRLNNDINNNNNYYNHYKSQFSSNNNNNYNSNSEENFDNNYICYDDQGHESQYNNEYEN